MVKDKLHELVDALPEGKVDTAGDFLAYLVDKERSQHILDVLESAPEEDMPPTTEELEAIKEAEEDIRAGRIRSYSEFKKEINS